MKTRWIMALAMLMFSFSISRAAVAWFNGDGCTSCAGWFDPSDRFGFCIKYKCTGTCNEISTNTPEEYNWKCTCSLGPFYARCETHISIVGAIVDADCVPPVCAQGGDCAGTECNLHYIAPAYFCTCD